MSTQMQPNGGSSSGNVVGVDLLEKLKICLKVEFESCQDVLE